MAFNKKEEKNRRMELRKSTGTRIITPPVVPAYNRGPEYAMSFVCFNCRKSFKRHYDGPPCDYPNKTTCLECKGVAVNLGRNFKAPKKSDTKQWKKVKFLVEHGFLFQKIKLQSDDYDTVPYPETLEEAKKFVIKYKAWALAYKPSATED